MGHVSGSHSLEGEKSSVGTQRTSFTLCDLKAWINCVIYKYENNYYFFSSMINYLSCFPPYDFCHSVIAAEVTITSCPSHFHTDCDFLVLQCIFYSVHVFICTGQSVGLSISMTLGFTLQ